MDEIKENPILEEIRNDPYLKVYNAIRPRMKSGDLLQWCSDTFVGHLIQKFTKSTVNHSSFIARIGVNNTEVDRVVILEATGRGIEVNALSYRLHNFKGEVFWYPLKDSLNAYRVKAVEWAFDNLDIPYDYKSVFRQMVSRVSKDARQLFCSELYEIAYIKAGLESCEEKACRPCDLPNLKWHKMPIRIYKRIE